LNRGDCAGVRRVARRAGRHTPSTLETRVREVIAGSGADVAVAFRTLDGRSELLIGSDKPFHAASTMKVPVMIELFRQAHARMLTLDEPLAIRNEFHSIVDGSTFALSEVTTRTRKSMLRPGRR
jgi:beta-lactamase class A